MTKALRLFYWSSKVFENKPQENYGDILSAFIVKSISSRSVVFFNAPKQRTKWFKRSYLMAIGSILKYASPKAVVWGSGIISREDTFGEATFCAVRGPLSRKRVLELGYECPEVYGDPALLLPKYYKTNVAKVVRYGIIPHYVDQQIAQSIFENKEDCKVLNLLNDDIFKVTDEINSCEYIISSSLHGVIVAHAYGIPAIWVQFSTKLSGDNVKYADYFESVDVSPYVPEMIHDFRNWSFFDTLLQNKGRAPSSQNIVNIQEGLIAAFPRQII